LPRRRPARQAARFTLLKDKGGLLTANLKSIEMDPTDRKPTTHNCAMILGTMWTAGENVLVRGLELLPPNKTEADSLAEEALEAGEAVEDPALTMEEVEALCKVLREDNCNLEKLDLSFNLLNVEQITMVTGALGARAARAMLTPGMKEGISVLDLRSNGCGDGAAPAVASLFSCITTIDLRFNGLRHGAATALVRPCNSPSASCAGWTCDATALARTA